MPEYLAKSLLVPIVLGLVGLIAIWVQIPFLAPSLASGVFSQVTTPSAPAARMWNISVGQVCGVAGGFVGVWLAGAGTAPPFFLDHHLVLLRVVAVAIAALITIVLQHALRATTPAGGATAVVVAVGAENATWPGFGHLLGGIVLVATLGEIARLVVQRMEASGEREAG